MVSDGFVAADSRLKPIMPKQRKRGTVRGSHKAIDYHDLPAFMQKLATNSDQSARALEVTILTFARTIEVQNMRWSQLDLESGIWDLGTLDTKNERLKRTPLPRQTLAYLREANESRVSDEFVFLGRSLAQPISNMTMLKHLKQITGDETTASVQRSEPGRRRKRISRRKSSSIACTTSPVMMLKRPTSAARL
jgi:integrase